MEPRTESVEIDVLFLREGDWWSAQCLQYDITAQARTIDDLRHELMRALLGHMAACLELGREPFADLGAAPQRYWDMWLKSGVKVELEPLPFRAPVMPRVAPKARIVEPVAA